MFNHQFNKGLTLKQLAIWLFIASTTTAADVELFDDPDSCNGKAAAFCLGVEFDTCCYRADKLYGSAGVGFVSTGTLQVYSKQNDQYCGVPISSENNTPVCIVSHLDLTISAALYRNHRVLGRMDCKREIKYQKLSLESSKTENSILSVMRKKLRLSHQVTEKALTMPPTLSSMRMLSGAMCPLNTRML